MSLNILAVDDHERTLQSLRMLLDRRFKNCKCLVSKSASETLEVVAHFEEQIHVAVIDFKLPDVEVDLPRKIREAYPKAMIIAFSAHWGDENALTIQDWIKDDTVNEIIEKDQDYAAKIVASIQNYIDDRALSWLNHPDFDGYAGLRPTLSSNRMMMRIDFDAAIREMENHWKWLSRSCQERIEEKLDVVTDNENGSASIDLKGWRAAMNGLAAQLNQDTNLDE